MIDKKKFEELEKEELENVNGGGCGGDDTPLVTHMVCQKCGYSVWWNGDYKNKKFDCPSCHEEAFKGESTMGVEEYKRDIMHLT